MRPPRIVDAHHHFWDMSLNYYPWLSDKVVIKPYGDYAAIRKNYLKANFRDDIGELAVVKSVHIDAGHDPADPIRETRWLQQLADGPGPLEGFPNGIVADGDLTRPDVDAVLEAQCAFRNIRGVRSMLSDSVRYPGERPDLLKSETWRHNVAILARYDLSLDLQLYPVQMPAGTPLSRPLHHSLPHRFARGRWRCWRERWREGMRAIAALPNIALKISGLSLFVRGWDTGDKPSIIREAIDIFGADRCMFGSDFPVDSLFSNYQDLWRAFFEATNDFSEDEVDRLYYGNAARLYRL